MDKKYTIVITRQYGCSGRTIGKILADALNLKYYDSDIFKDNSSLELPESVEKSISKMLDREKLKPLERFLSPSSWVEHDEEENELEARSIIMHYLAGKDSTIFVGCCADHILGDVENVIRIYLKAPFPVRVENYMKKTGMSREDATRYVAEKEEERRSNYRHFTGFDLGNINHQEIGLDVSLLGTEGSAKFLETFIRSIP